MDKAAKDLQPDNSFQVPERMSNELIQYLLQLQPANSILIAYMEGKGIEIPLGKSLRLRGEFVIDFIDQPQQVPNAMGNPS